MEKHKQYTDLLGSEPDLSKLKIHIFKADPTNPCSPEQSYRFHSCEPFHAIRRMGCTRSYWSLWILSVFLIKKKHSYNVSLALISCSWWLAYKSKSTCWSVQGLGFFFFHIQYDINLISSGKQLIAIKESAIYQKTVNPFEHAGWKGKALKTTETYFS